MYIIRKTETPITTLCDAAWEQAELAELQQLNWKEDYPYNPGMQARILYSNFGIHIKLTTQEQPLLARETKQNGDVCKDSCMEFFFRPNVDDPRYLNFEFNPFGTMYLGIRTGRDDSAFPTEDKKYFGAKSEVDDKEWNLMFTVPFEFIERNFGKCDKVMYGNLYKCGDEVENTHYLTYYPIDVPEPDYHRPEFFDKFVLE